MMLPIKEVHLLLTKFYPCVPDWPRCALRCVPLRTALRCVPVSCVPENLAKFVLRHLPETNPETNSLPSKLTPKLMTGALCDRRPKGRRWKVSKLTPKLMIWAPIMLSNLQPRVESPFLFLRQKGIPFKLASRVRTLCGPSSVIMNSGSR